jgi:hypothetical protein
MSPSADAAPAKSLVCVPRSYFIPTTRFEREKVSPRF